MVFHVYVKGFSPETTLEELIMYFQSKKAGGGDVDLDNSRIEKGQAIIAFDEERDRKSVIKRPHTLNGAELIVSENKFDKKGDEKKETKKRRPKSQSTPQLCDEPILGEVRTVIVSDISDKTTDDVLMMFFESEKRSGGGEIENLRRIEPKVAHITFTNAEVASNVLKKEKLEVGGYLLQLKEKPPELKLPVDKRKLYIENINPNTTEDSLTNYIELITKQGVRDVQFGGDRNALITFATEPDMGEIKTKTKTKQLEGAVLSISNPPVYNSILVAGLTNNTTKEAIELKFENAKTGGGKIHGEIDYKKERGEAVVSFCDPKVTVSVLGMEQTLNGSLLTVSPYYPFMKENKSSSTENKKVIKVEPDVMNYISRYREQEFFERLGFPMAKMVYDQHKSELTLEAETTAVENYVSEFTVQEIRISKKLLERSGDDLKKNLAAKTKEIKDEAVAEVDELSIQISGKEKEVYKLYNAVKIEVEEMEKQLNFENIELRSLNRDKLMLFLFHGFDEQLKSEFNVEVTIDPQKEKIEIHGPKEQACSAKMKAFEELARVQEDYYELSERKKDFLLSGGLDSINDGLKKQNLQALICLDRSKPNRAKVQVYNTTKEDVDDYVLEHMQEENYLVDDESLGLLKSKKWDDFKRSLSLLGDNQIRIIVVNNPRAEIWLTGKKSQVKQAGEKLEDFLRRNTIVSVSIEVCEGTGRHLSTYYQNDINEMEKKLEEQQVRVQLKGKEFFVYGTKEGVEKAQRKMQAIIQSITVKTIPIDKPRTKEYLQSNAGSMSLTGIQTRYHCTVRLTNDSGQRSMEITPVAKPRQNRTTSTLLCSYKTTEKLLLRVYQGDITTHQCDVIVNAANGGLKHIGGVAGMILDVGGKEIQEDCDQHVRKSGDLYDGECYSGIPGKLPCKRLIHAVGPQWDNTNRVKHRNTLKLACAKTLQEAGSYRTVAFPAIGSGVFGVPKDVCASAMIEAVMEFSSTSPGSRALEEVHFVNIDSPTSQVFVKHFRKQFSTKGTFIDNQTGPNTIKHTLQAEVSNSRSSIDSDTWQVSRSAPDCITTRTQTRIAVVVGDLSTHTADVVVNTTSGNLQLDSNPCSKALSEKAGPILQNECNRIGTLQAGQVAATNPGKLRCKKVYHVMCSQWDSGKGKRTLRRIIRDCLEKSHSSGMTSIAFPAIGTGVLGFPHNIAAEVCFEEAKEFGKRNPKSCLKDIRFVVYNQDQTSSKAFQDELQKQPEWRGVKNTAQSRQAQRISVTESGETQRLPRSPYGDEKGGRGEICVQINGDSEIQVVRGDITKETTNVIAHLSNTELKMVGGVARAIVIAGGNKIEEECSTKKSIREYSVVVTKAGRLKVDYIAHMVAPDRATLNDIDKSIFNCLKGVDSLGCKSISFPAVGTGVLDARAEMSAKTMLRSIVRFLQAGGSQSLKKVRIIITDDNILEAFSTVVKQLLQDESPGIFKKVIDYFWKSEPAVTNIKEKVMDDQEKPRLFLEICANDSETVNEVEKTIDQIMDDKKKKELFEDDEIEKLSGSQIAKIQKMGKDLDVNVTVDISIKRIILSGHVDDISKVKLEIQSTLSKIKLAEQEKENAEMVSQGVQWFWEDLNGGQVKYDKHINAFIEKAYMKKEKTVIFLLQEGQCELEFDKMEETNLTINEVTKVTRKDLKDIPVPEYWDPQPKDVNGKEVPVHLVRLDQRNPDHVKELKKICERFLQTAKGHTIQRVERIQNPTLFKAYALKKRSMDEQNGSNETYLFHGTRADKISTINKDGLNRSYAGGANGALFGRGVYFAKDASMSVGYAPVDAAGNRAMYIARVAVGLYTTGDPSMIVPPKINAGNNYDSVVNDTTTPEIYVMFYDNQYYPEYMITFQ